VIRLEGVWQLALRNWMRSWPWNLPASTFPDVEEHMNRTVKSVQSMVLAGVLFVAGAYFGARVVTQGVVATKQVNSGIVLVDGPTKPCAHC
jgi:hypothetical protein